MNTCNWNCNETGGCDICNKYDETGGQQGRVVAALEKRIEELEATIEQIIKYVRHTEDCEVSLVHRAYAPVCDCRYVEALDEYGKTI